jgi:hypothetical protein
VHPKEFYTHQLNQVETQFKEATKKFRLYTMLRLICFVFIILAIYWYHATASDFILPMVGLGIFLFLVSQSSDAKLQREKMRIMIQFYQEELAVLTGDWSHYDSGERFKDGKHPFSTDMDLFGTKSIYQLLNRTVTHLGSLKLSKTLKEGTTDKGLNQAAISDLSKQIHWCYQFLTEAKVFLKDNEKEESIRTLKLLIFNQQGIAKVFKVLVPLAAISALIMNVLDLISSSTYLLCFLACLLPTIKFLPITNANSKVLNVLSNKIKGINQQLLLIQKLKLESPIFKEKIHAFLDGEAGVIDAIKQLDKISQRYDFRLNVLVGIVLNSFLAWDLRLLIDLRKWMNKHQENLEIWEEELAQMEVWISGSIYYFNHPESIFSESISEEEPIEMIGLKHPFVSVDKCVSNDFKMDVDKHFVILTGPNMAGKSTYLRSVGLCFVFANAGFPVLAEKCRIPEISLYTSMRTSDDLTIESSYFHAELMRLRFIVDAIDSGKKVFIILDEILKGTNSKDKEEGSAMFLTKLRKLQTKGIIATHDLSLCNLANADAAFVNKYFDSTIHENELSFDYRINDGICQNMNASFLLKKMELVD